MNTSVDAYFIEGCGRCSLGGTPNCKVHAWHSELKYLRKIALSCGLIEESKWGVPCYTYQNKNIVLINAFKNYCSLNFFKGTLLRDQEQLLVKPGPNSQVSRIFKFYKVDEIIRLETHIKAYIFEAIELEINGEKILIKQKNEPIPVELIAEFEENPDLKIAFESLTKGRQRGYILYFSQPKQEKTRIARIEKCIPMIMKGIGIHDQYKSKKE